MNFGQRVRTEQRIATKLVGELLSHGFHLSLLGEGEPLLKATAHGVEILKYIDACDWVTVEVWQPTGEYVGGIGLIHGESGWDLINDYHTNLEQYMTNTLAFCEALMNADNPDEVE